jgi:hypothetical protein
MAFKLIESAQHRWRVVNAPHLVALVRASTTFGKGTLIEHPTDPPAIDTGEPHDHPEGSHRTASRLSVGSAYIARIVELESTHV